MKNATDIGGFAVDYGKGRTVHVHFVVATIPVFVRNGGGGVKQSKQTVQAEVRFPAHRMKVAGLAHCSPDEDRISIERGMSIALDRALVRYTRSEAYTLIKKAFRAWLELRDAGEASTLNFDFEVIE